MLQTILNLFRKPAPAMPSISEQVYEIALKAVRDEMGRKPSPAEARREDLARAVAATEAEIKRRGRPRKWGFYELEVGETCRTANKKSIRGNLYTHARASGKKFTTTTKANGLWIKRVA